MVFPEIETLSLVSIMDAGIPNKERVCISVNDYAQMGHFGVVLSMRTDNDLGRILNDNFFWFGTGIASPGDWIFLYTGSGINGSKKIPGSDRNIYSVFWGRKETFFGDGQISPFVIAMSAVRNSTGHTSVQKLVLP